MASLPDNPSWPQISEVRAIICLRAACRPGVRTSSSSSHLGMLPGKQLQFQQHELVVTEIFVFFPVSEIQAFNAGDSGISAPASCTHDDPGEIVQHHGQETAVNVAAEDVHVNLDLGPASPGHRGCRMYLIRSSKRRKILDVFLVFRIHQSDEQGRPPAPPCAPPCESLRK